MTNQKEKNARTIFLGTPAFAATVLRYLIGSPYQPVLVITELDKPVGRKQILTAPPVKLLAREHAIPIAEPSSHMELAEVIRHYQPDFLLVAAYGRILRPDVLALPKMASLNVHASLLPAYRGASPIQAALLNGDNETGVTIMGIEEGLDTGPIYAQKKTSIQPEDTLPSLSNRLAELGGALLVQVLPEIAHGTLTPHPQTETDATVTRLLTKESGKLNGSQSPEQILRMLRAYTPWPGVWMEIDGQHILLHAAHLVNSQLEPDLVQLAGKKPVDWRTFQSGHPNLAKKVIEFVQK